MRDGTVSLATAPEPGSRCTPRHIDDDAARLPNLWGVNGKQSGVLYEREQDGVIVYSTRNLPGSTRLMAFTVTPPPDATAHPGLGSLGPPQPAAYSAIFHAAARANGIDDARVMIGDMQDIEVVVRAVATRREKYGELVGIEPEAL